eukprot:TRINITY_DN4211_c0_g1_i1.p1 TRINITY_DN4211_c0_g1~~TRINITY_DN4211_c0_g1_i1.p1  ORF type:complete len:224 (-),score=19.66 TRINITY_DN4211_c0_g1_i1:16-687(-)
MLFCLPGCHSFPLHHRTGPLGYDGLLIVLRKFYHHRLVEPIILGSIAAHMASSTWLFVQRAKTMGGTLPYVKNAASKFSLSTLTGLSLHRITGWGLAAAIVGHVGATRGLVIKFPEWLADFSFLSYSFHMLPQFFYPYYIALAAAGLYHMSYGLLRPPIDAGTRPSAAVASLRSASYSLPFRVAMGVGAVACVSSVLALAGWYFPTPVHTFSKWDVYYRMLFS